VTTSRRPWGLRPWEIKKALAERGESYASIAERAGCAVGEVFCVVEGYEASRVIRRAVADVLQMDYARVWGGDARVIGRQEPRQAGSLWAPWARRGPIWRLR